METVSSQQPKEFQINHRGISSIIIHLSAKNKFTSGADPPEVVLGLVDDVLSASRAYSEALCLLKIFHLSQVYDFKNHLQIPKDKKHRE